MPEIGNQYFAFIPEASPYQQKLMEIETLGTHLGIGNRWFFGNHFTIGVDWVAWSQPLLKIKEEKKVLSLVNQEDKDNAVKTIHWMTYFPRLSILNFNIGGAFWF